VPSPGAPRRRRAWHTIRCADVGNAQLSKELGMSLSTAHRYLTTLVATGLVERKPTTRKYRLANAR
jgi:DNA-binding IclR family transcriptional regulator